MSTQPVPASPETGHLEQAMFGVLAVHRHLPQYVDNQRRHVWREISFTPTAKRRVQLLGQGPAVDDTRRQLDALGFPVAMGDVPGCDILLCVSPGELPAADCEGILAGLAPDASVVVVGQAGEALLVALRMALGEGRVTAAYLALAGLGPLARDDALWSHPHVMVAPLG